MTAFYEKNKQRMGGATRDQVADRIRSFLDEQRNGEVTAALRKRANVTLMLEPPRVTVAAEGPSLGPADAPVTIIEFSDFQCPYCGRAASDREAGPRALSDSRCASSTATCRSKHPPNARPAAEASACADAQGQFWEYPRSSSSPTSARSPRADLQRYAKEVGLDAAAFERA